MWFALGFLVALAGVILYGVRRSESRAVRAVAVLVAVVLVLPAGLGIYLSTPGDGDRVAAERAQTAVTAVADEIVEARRDTNQELDGEELALYTVQSVAEHEEGRGAWDVQGVEIMVLGWSGTTADRRGPAVDLRVEAHVPYEPGALLGRSRAEGRAVRCWRLVAKYHDAAEVDEIDCPATPVGQVPAPAVSPTLCGRSCSGPAHRLAADLVRAR